MDYKLEIGKSAERDFKRLEPKYQARIAVAMRALSIFG